MPAGSLVRACHLQNDTIFVRLPIRLKLLNRLLRLIQTYIIGGKGQVYLGRWLKAIFVMAYYGLMRVSELVGAHAVAATDVVYAEKKKRVTLYLRSSKTHTKADPPKVIYISGSCKMGGVCPYKIISEFAEVRGRRTLYAGEPFLVHQDGNPISEYQYRTNLTMLLGMLKHNPNLFGTHSFRGGRASDLRKAGRTVEFIKHEGRWVSTGTVYKYFSDF